MVVAITQLPIYIWLRDYLITKLQKRVPVSWAWLDYGVRRTELAWFLIVIFKKWDWVRGKYFRLLWMKSQWHHHPTKTVECPAHKKGGLKSRERREAARMASSRCRFALSSYLKVSRALLSPSGGGRIHKPKVNLATETFVWASKQHTYL